MSATVAITIGHNPRMLGSTHRSSGCWRAPATQNGIGAKHKPTPTAIDGNRSTGNEEHNHRPLGSGLRGS
jgi:hypothetical protein